MPSPSKTQTPDVRRERNREAAKKCRMRKKKQIEDLEKSVTDLSSQIPDAIEPWKKLYQMVEERDKLIKERDQAIEERDRAIEEREYWRHIASPSKIQYDLMTATYTSKACSELQFPPQDATGPCSYSTTPEIIPSRVSQRQKPDTKPQFSTEDCLPPSEVHKSQRSGEATNRFHLHEYNDDPTYCSQSAWGTNFWGQHYAYCPQRQCTTRSDIQ